jgi:hypothetical protein
MMVADIGLAALSGINSMTRFPLYRQYLAADCPGKTPSSSRRLFKLKYRYLRLFFWFLCLLVVMEESLHNELGHLFTI